MSEANINDQSFEAEVLKSAEPVLVDFYAVWCTPCQIQAPIIEELAKEYQGKAKILSMDVDQSPMTANNFQIFSIPTMIIFKDGAPVERLVGLQQKNAIKEKLDKLV